MRSKKLVVVTDPVVPDLSLLHEVLSDFEVVALPQADIETRNEFLMAANGILVNLMTIDAAIIDLLKACKVISRFGVGSDNIALSACASAGIHVTVVPDYCTDEVSDHVLALLLTIVRKISSANASVNEGRWGTTCVTPIRRVRGQTAGLVGCGRIGRALVPKLLSLGSKVIVFDPYVTPEGRIEAVEYVSFDELLNRSDAISLHAPARRETENIIDAAAFTKMRRGVVLINTARGTLVDEQALVNALDEGIVGGAGLDVVRTEPIEAGSPLLGRDNVILTPHIAYYSEESLADLQIKAAEEIRRVLRGLPPRNAVKLTTVQAR